ncbi:hypothetical protein vseg_001242 [Gypsophila vaccaria]
MYTNLVHQNKAIILQLLLTLTLTILLHLTHLSSLLIRGLNTYIHPDDVTSSKPNPPSPRIAISTPSSASASASKPNAQPQLTNRKKPPKAKDHRFEFDESKAQIFRLKLGDPQIQSRLFFDTYTAFFNCFLLFLCSFLVHKCLKVGSLLPVLIGVVGLFRVLVSGFRVSVERSAYKRVERQLGLVFSVLGFCVGGVICCGMCPAVVDFEFGAIHGFGRLVVAVLCGCIVGFLYMGAGKNARAFWLGTDQIRCSLSIVSCGWFAQIMFYVSYLLAGFTSLLWIKPFGEVFVIKVIDGGPRGGAKSGGLIDNVGMSEAEFVRFRLICLLLTGLFQVITLRLNVQTFLNEAVLSWYQRLHSSTTPDMEYSRAKVFLHNHYLCLAVVQFFAPAALILILLGLSQVDGGLFDNFQAVCGVLPCSIFAKETSLFLAWWVAFVWFVFSSAYLALYRRGLLHIS